MKKPGSSSSKAVPPFLHIKGIPHAALLAFSPCFCGLDVPPRPQGLLGFVCLFGFGFPLPSTGPALTAPRQLSQGSCPSSPFLSHTATCLCHFSFCLSHRQVTVLWSPANPIHPSLSVPSSPRLFEKKDAGAIFLPVSFTPLPLRFFHSETPESPLQILALPQ